MANYLRYRVDSECNIKRSFHRFIELFPLILFNDSQFLIVPFEVQVHLLFLRDNSVLASGLDINLPTFPVYWLWRDNFICNYCFGFFHLLQLLLCLVPNFHKCSLDIEHHTFVLLFFLLFWFNNWHSKPTF